MGAEYRRGFKKQAEDLAIEVRCAMGLDWRDLLDPRALARHVGVVVLELGELAGHGLSAKSLQYLLGRGRREFSAAMVECNGARLIVANPSHSTGRQASNIVHEVSHLLLRHDPPEAILEAGCRRWDGAMELEADWLAGELLVPRRAALDVARQQVDVSSAAQHFGVSEKLMEWRLNNSGARKQASRERGAWGRRYLLPVEGRRQGV
jgi:Zn-dependent peptidase ImmA (M78 family)